MHLRCTPTTTFIREWGGEGERPPETRRLADYAAAADHPAFGRWFHGLLDEGVYVPPSGYEAWFVSLAHTESDIDATVEAANRALDA